MTRMSERTARTMTGKIKANLVDLEKNLKEFHALQGWFVLGYESFTEWWDAELGEIPMALGLRNWVIYMMADESPQTNGRRAPGSNQFIGDVIGVSAHAVRGLLAKKTRERNRMTVTGKNDDETVYLAFGVPNLWRKHIIETARKQDVNMADLLRPIVAHGMKTTYGVDVDAAIKRPATARR